jgi:hypothetical protein
MQKDMSMVEHKVRDGVELVRTKTERRRKMRKVVTVCMALTMGALLLASYAVAQDSSTHSLNKSEIQQLYTDYLKAEGYKPEVDADGDVIFKRDGRTYFIQVSEKDPEFFRIVLANIWSVEDEKERAKVLVAADSSNAKSKVSKVHTLRNNVWVSVEFFFERPEDFKGVFRRAMSALDNGAFNFAINMRE